jgi:uncharacterized protein YegP (UPF0339 family)
MTGATQATNAMRKPRADPSSSREPEPLAFLVYEDNVGGYHWRIVGDGGETLVRSASFGSYGDARHAARIVHRGASRATFEQGSESRPPADLPVHRHHMTLTLRDRADAERWLDEGGSFGSEALSG